MIKRIEIVTKGNLDTQADVKKYAESKIAKLDKYINRHARKSAHAEIKLMQENSKKNEKFTAEVILHLPSENITAKEATLNIYAAIDIVEAKLKNQLRKYKDKHTISEQKTDRKNVLSRVRKIADKDFWGSQN